MRKLCLKILAVLLAWPAVALAADPGVALEPANNNVANVASLQRGARYFVNYCLGCHSAQYVRYNRLAQDLGITEQQLTENLMFTGESPFDTMRIAMPRQAAESWFGIMPPDLSLIARARGTDYLYTFLRSFYQDPAAGGATNNRVLPLTSMPHVLWELQGVQRAVYREVSVDGGQTQQVLEGFETVIEGALEPAQFDQVVRDIVNFLDYIGEPVQLQRQRLGIWVIAFLLVFLLFAWMLKREIWKDVK